MSIKNISLKDHLKKIKLVISIIIIILTVSTFIYNQNFSTVAASNKISLRFIETSNSMFIGTGIQILKDTGITSKENNNFFVESATKVDFGDIILQYDLKDFNISPNSISFTISKKFKKRDFSKEEYLEKIKKIKKELLLKLTETINLQINQFLVPSITTLYQEIIYLNVQQRKINKLYEISKNDEKIELIKLEESIYGNYSPIHLKNFEESKNYNEFLNFYTINFKIVKIDDENAQNHKIIRYTDLLIIIICLIAIYISLNLFFNKIRN